MLRQAKKAKLDVPSQLEIVPDISDSIADSTLISATSDSSCNLTSATIYSGTQQQQPTTQQIQYSDIWSTDTDGKKLATIGPKVTSWTNKSKTKFNIQKVEPHVPPNAHHMYEMLKPASDIRTRLCRLFGNTLMHLWGKKTKGEDVPVTSNVRTRTENKYRTWGRICWESEIKLPNTLVLLESCRKAQSSRDGDARKCEVELDFNNTKECCIFPGQILAVEGFNLTGDVFRVNEVFSEYIIPPAKVPRLQETLKITFAAGPFTPSNNLDYKPLWDLMSRVVEDEPHILILIGPFLDESHQLIQNDELSCSHKEFFNNLIIRIMGYLKEKCTQVIIVASGKDAHHFVVYPTPEYNLSNNLKNPSLHTVPDPCVLDVEGLKIGLTSVDSLMHLGREEVVVKPSSMDKLSRLGNYILSQACFYPLYPPAKEVNIDTELWEKFAFLSETPHILLLPSDMRRFCKQIQETLVVNPERLCKRMFARLNITPPVNNTWSPNNISCEIIKV